MSDNRIVVDPTYIEKSVKCLIASLHHIKNTTAREKRIAFAMLNIDSTINLLKSIEGDLKQELFKTLREEEDYETTPIHDGEIVLNWVLEKIGGQ